MLAMARIADKRRTLIAEFVHLLAYPIVWLLHKLGIWDE
jgi:hypothetical protein